MKARGAKKKSQDDEDAPPQQTQLQPHLTASAQRQLNHISLRLSESVLLLADLLRIHTFTDKIILKVNQVSYWTGLCVQMNLVFLFIQAYNKIYSLYFPRCPA